jgi:hypothetical protein
MPKKLKNMKEGTNLEDHVNERVLLNWILKEVRQEYVDRTYRDQNSVQWLPVVNTLMNLRIP